MRIVWLSLKKKIVKVSRLLNKMRSAKVRTCQRKCRWKTEKPSSASCERKWYTLSISHYHSLLTSLLLRKAESSRANRASLVEEAAKAKVTAREAARLERQRKLAEILRTKADAEERGEDVERQKNWEYTIEENDEWEKKSARKKRRADFEFHGKLSSLFFLVFFFFL